jgi:hypothetical protein
LVVPPGIPGGSDALELVAGAALDGAVLGLATGLVTGLADAAGDALPEGLGLGLLVQPAANASAAIATVVSCACLLVMTVSLGRGA